ncbi:MAG TPA: hypothetical protein VL307_15280, partial [Chitinophagaceae bacterium]|nr:hypothetical protein [Chitinophagaceae bacterium]
QTGGYHRTSAENADRNGQRQTAAGAQLKYSGNKLHWGISTVYYRFSKSIEKADRPYNLFALQGNNFINAAIDYSYTFRNLHVFGELATDKNLHPAMLSAAVLSLHSNVDAALVYRKMARAYQSVNANAFTENSSPVNEEGFYAGLSIRPAAAWRLDAYADLARFPWLRYRVDAPSTGKDFLVQLNYTPGKQAAAYIRWKTESKWMNLDDEVFTNHHVSALTKNNVRLQLSIALSRALSLDHRAELIINQAPDSSRPTGHSNTQGFLSYLSMACAPARSNWSGNIRLQYFETDGYNERLYAYENDLPYSFSIPFFYDKGIRYYLNLQWDISKIYNASKRKTMRISIGGKWAQTIYAGKTSIGSGLDEINGHRHTEAKLQLIVKH